MIAQVAATVCAAVALWYALKGLLRMWRARWDVTAGAVGCLVVGAAALGLALWVEWAGAEALGDAAGDVVGWLGDRLGVDAWWERLAGWARRQWLEVLRQLREMAGVG